MQVLNTNVTSFLEMVRLVTKKNQFNPGLSIVSISSVSSLVGGPGVAVYAASKAAIDASIRCLAKELYKKEIRINSVISGQINTLAYQKFIESKTDSIDPVLERQYLGLGNTNDVANVILFLLSVKSRFISGAAVPADGGFLS
jgi:NAD(P)-dependent dehydrogenase (short-subunit alcohol dehydrogenase family)